MLSVHWAIHDKRRSIGGLFLSVGLRPVGLTPVWKTRGASQRPPAGHTPSVCLRTPLVMSLWHYSQISSIHRFDIHRDSGNRSPADTKGQLDIWTKSCLCFQSVVSLDQNPRDQLVPQQNSQHHFSSIISLIYVSNSCLYAFAKWTVDHCCTVSTFWSLEELLLKQDSRFPIIGPNQSSQSYDLILMYTLHRCLQMCMISTIEISCCLQIWIAFSCRTSSMENWNHIISWAESTSFSL